jgi:predicted nucleotidyltransferase
MISESDKETILRISKKYRVKRVLLFGSSLNSKYESNDIDIGVEGIQSKDFFKYYGELIIGLSKPVDIVDISGSSKFITLIKTEGIPLYD